MLHLCFPPTAALWKHHSCSCTSSACHSRSICFKKGWPYKLVGPALFWFTSVSPHFPPKAVLLWRINSTPLTSPPYSGVAHAITISPMPALLSSFHSPVLLMLGLFLWKAPLHPPTHSSRFSLCVSYSKRPSSALGATLCSSVYESLPLLSTIHLDTSSFTTLHS